MNPLRLDQALAHAVGDVAEENISRTARWEAILRAIREYSRYSYQLRRYGTGSLFAGARVGETTLLVAGGGGFTDGATLVIDEHRPASKETVTIQTVEDAEDTVAQLFPVTVLTLTGAITKDHKIGAYCALPTPGLTLIAGQATYLLPGDWIGLEKDSFDQAIGSSGRGKKQMGFYDALYDFSGAMSGAGFGMRQNFGYGAGRGYPIAGNPWRNPNGGAAAAFPTSALFRFSEGVPKLLTIDPAPTAATTLNFWYRAMHTVESLPEHDFEPILSYATYAALTSLAGTFAEMLPYSEDDVTERPEAAAQALLQLAQTHLDAFNVKMRRRPFITSG